MKKKYIIRLTNTERQELRDLMRKGHAQILLLADEGDHDPGLRDAKIAEQIGVNERTVSRLRLRCVEQWLDAALERQPRKRERSRVLDGDGEAQLVALMCGEPPPGQPTLDTTYDSRPTGGTWGRRLHIARSCTAGFKKTLLSPGGKP